MNNEEALALLAKVQMTWPQKTLPPETIAIWAEGIKDLPRQAVLASIEQLSTTSDFLPSLAALRKGAMAVQPGMAVPDADEAWSELKREIRRVGSKTKYENWTSDPTWNKPSFSHSAIADAVHAMNWDELCGSSNEEATRAHFFKLYSVITNRVTREQTATPSYNALAEALSSAVKRLPEDSTAGAP